MASRATASAAIRIRRKPSSSDRNTITWSRGDCIAYGNPKN